MALVAPLACQEGGNGTHRSTDISDVHDFRLGINVSVVLFGELVIVRLGTNALDVVELRELLPGCLRENGLTRVSSVADLTDGG